MLDTTIFRSLIAPMAKEVTVTILLDSTNTGVMFDMPYSWSTIRDNIDSSAKLSLNDDFSFVRILKILKHVYEKSTCTEISKSHDETICFDSDSSGDSLCTDDGNEARDNNDDDHYNEKDSLHTAKVNAEAMITTIGEYFKPPKGPQKKGGSTRPPTGLSKKAGSVQKRSDSRDASNTDRTDNFDSIFSGIGAVRSLSAQNLYSQVVSALGQTEEPKANHGVNEEAAQQSAAYYEDDNVVDNDDDSKNYFVQDSFSNESGAGYL